MKVYGRAQFCYADRRHTADRHVLKVAAKHKVCSDEYVGSCMCRTGGKDKVSVNIFLLKV